LKGEKGWSKRFKNQARKEGKVLPGVRRALKEKKRTQGNTPQVRGGNDQFFGPDKKIVVQRRRNTRRREKACRQNRGGWFRY